MRQLQLTGRFCRPRSIAGLHAAFILHSYDLSSAVIGRLQVCIVQVLY